jgi:hypothetical protein
LASAQPASDSLLGFVVDTTGVWMDRACACPALSGHTVFRRSELVPRDPSAKQVMHIRVFSTQKLETFNCATLDCNRPLDVLARMRDENAPGNLALASRAIVSILQDMTSTEGKPGTLAGFSRAMSRTIGDVELSDAVVTGDLSSVFARMPKGTYLVDFCPIGEMGQTQCEGPPRPTSFTWTDGTASLSANLRDGLYEAFYCTRDDVRTTRLNSAWVLVVKDRDRAQSLRSQYESFLAAIADWSPREISMLSHASLAALRPRGEK